LLVAFSEIGKNSRQICFRFNPPSDRKHLALVSH
jgi:hypothetical protein